MTTIGTVRPGSPIAVGLTLTMTLVLAAGATAQEVLERPIGADHLGPAVVWAPEAIATGLWARRVAQGARVAIVFETAAPTPAAGLPERVDLTGLTVREALDALVARAPQYAWRQVGDAIVVRATAAWEDAAHPLHRAAGEEAAGDQPLSAAIRQVVGAEAPVADLLILAASVDGGKAVTRREGPRPAALDRVAELAAEGEWFVLVRDPRVSPGPYLDVATWDGRSYPLEASAAIREEAGR
jgi:hypothetical protein